MAFPTCKLIMLTGPLGFPEKVSLGVVRDGDRFQVRRVTLMRIKDFDRSFFEFDNQDLIPFQNPLQLRFGLNAVGDAQDLGETIINADDTIQGVTTAQFRPSGIGGPFYELTYKVLPG